MPSFSTKGEPDGADSGGSDIDIAEYSCSPRGPLSHLVADLCVTSGCHSCCHTGCFHRTGTCFWNCQHDQFCKVKTFYLVYTKYYLFLNILLCCFIKKNYFRD